MLAAVCLPRRRSLVKLLPSAEQAGDTLRLRASRDVPAGFG